MEQMAFKIGKGVHQGCISSLCLLCEMPGWMNHNLESRLLGERSINNLRYADDTTLMAESKEKLKSLLMRVKEESEKTKHSKNEDHGIWSYHFMANR